MFLTEVVRDEFRDFIDGKTFIRIDFAYLDGEWSLYIFEGELHAIAFYYDAFFSYYIRSEEYPTSGFRELHTFSDVHCNWDYVQLKNVNIFITEYLDKFYICVRSRMSDIFLYKYYGEV